MPSEERIGRFEPIMANIGTATSDELLTFAIELIGALEDLQPEDSEYLWSINECVFRAMRRVQQLRSDDQALLVRLAQGALQVALRIDPGKVLEAAARERLGMAHEAGGNFAEAAREFEIAVALYADRVPVEVKLMALLGLCSNLESAERFDRLHIWSLKLLSLSEQSVGHAMACRACAFQERCAVWRNDWSAALNWVDAQMTHLAKAKKPERMRPALLDLESRAVDYRSKLGVV